MCIAKLPILFSNRKLIFSLNRNSCCILVCTLGTSKICVNLSYITNAGSMGILFNTRYWQHQVIYEPTVDILYGECRYVLFHYLRIVSLVFLFSSSFCAVAYRHWIWIKDSC